MEPVSTRGIGHKQISPIVRVLAANDSRQADVPTLRDVDFNNRSSPPDYTKAQERPRQNAGTKTDWSIGRVLDAIKTFCIENIPLRLIDICSAPVNLFRPHIFRGVGGAVLLLPTDWHTSHSVALPTSDKKQDRSSTFDLTSNFLRLTSHIVSSSTLAEIKGAQPLLLYLVQRVCDASRYQYFSPSRATAAHWAKLQISEAQTLPNSSVNESLPELMLTRIKSSGVIIRIAKKPEYLSRRDAVFIRYEMHDFGKEYPVMPTELPNQEMKDMLYRIRSDGKWRLPEGQTLERYFAISNFMQDAGRDVSNWIRGNVHTLPAVRSASAELYQETEKRLLDLWDKIEQLIKQHHPKISN